jgi:hypothetical protein
MNNAHARPFGRGDANLSFGMDGPKLGENRLLEKTTFGYEPLCHEALKAIVRHRVNCQVLHDALSTVAKYMTAGDTAMAAIATALLPIRADTETPINIQAIGKASPEDPEHPGWPAKSPDGEGGEYRPKNASDSQAENQDRVQRLQARRGFRAALKRVLSFKRLLRLGAEGASEAIPGAEVVGTISLIQDLTSLGRELAEEAKNVDAAIEFGEKGAHTIEEMSVGGLNEEAFSSFRAFKKIDLVKRFGPAGDGYEYHHIVEQGPNEGKIPSEKLNSTSNIIRIPKLLHEEITSIYSSKNALNTGNLSTREIMRSQSFEQQRELGLEILRRMGVLAP